MMWYQINKVDKLFRDYYAKNNKAAQQHRFISYKIIYSSAMKKPIHSAMRKLANTACEVKKRE